MCLDEKETNDIVRGWLTYKGNVREKENRREEVGTLGWTEETGNGNDDRA